ncbi:hypothetical protein F4777DRAFT_576832 [Nemania sp. FL0916]|nr:hypothetical protein F4777DRAFT_576832 [Nemania sp. FL0916]
MAERQQNGIDRTQRPTQGPRLNPTAEQPSHPRPPTSRILDQLSMSEVERKIVLDIQQGRVKPKRNKTDGEQAAMLAKTLGLTDAPIHSIDSLLVLNEFRNSLGLGPSMNLISSQVYRLDSASVADLYKKPGKLPWG